jgi:hypothetical protein
MDILELTTVSASGNRYILVIGDYFSKWKEAYAIPDHTAYTVVRLRRRTDSEVRLFRLRRSEVRLRG